MPESTRPVPQQLVKAIASERCVLFVGSGLSKHTRKFPLWNDFVGQVLRVLPESPTSLGVTSDEILSGYKLEFLEYAQRFHANKYRELLSEVLRNPYPDVVAEAHRFIASMPWRAIITTNLDTLLEDAYQASFAPRIVVTDERSISRIGEDHGTPIVKLHGSVDSEYQVLTLAEYQNFEAHRQGMQSLAVALLSQYPVLIVGAGLTDRNFQRLYAVLHRTMARFQQRSFYVSPALPKFVQAVWEHRGLEMISVAHDDLTEWLRSLEEAVRLERRRVENAQLAHPIDELNKERALVKLGEALEDYTALQEQYTAAIQMPDYAVFTTQWERTLYLPLRSVLHRAMQRHPQRDLLVYFAPGPHAPVLSGAQPRRSLASELAGIAVVDISRDVVSRAYQRCIEITRETSCTVQRATVDFSCGACSRMCGIFADALEKRSPREVSLRLHDAAAVVDAIMPLGESDALASRVAESVLEQGVSLGTIAYSEMVAAFTATPILLAFRSRLYRQFGANRDYEADIEVAMESVAAIWRRYNDRFYEVHLRTLAKMVERDGLVIVAVDTDKIFEDPKIAPIPSFSSTGTPICICPGLVAMDGFAGKPLSWIDHESGLAVSVGGHEVNDFLPHHHQVSVVAYRRE